MLLGFESILYLHSSTPDLESRSLFSGSGECSQASPKPIVCRSADRSAPCAFTLSCMRTLTPENILRESLPTSSIRHQSISDTVKNKKPPMSSKLTGAGSQSSAGHSQGGSQLAKDGTTYLFDGGVRYPYYEQVTGDSPYPPVHTYQSPETSQPSRPSKPYQAANPSKRPAPARFDSSNCKTL